MQNAKGQGDYVAIMDADCDPPTMLPEMYRTIKEGYDCAVARRVNRMVNQDRSFFARRFIKS